MIGIILDAVAYCCFREKEKQKSLSETVLDHLEQMAEHEIEHVLKKLNYVKKPAICC